MSRNITVTLNKPAVRETGKPSNGTPFGDGILSPKGTTMSDGRFFLRDTKTGRNPWRVVYKWDDGAKAVVDAQFASEADARAYLTRTLAKPGCKHWTPRKPSDDSRGTETSNGFFTGD